MAIQNPNIAQQVLGLVRLDKIEEACEILINAPIAPKGYELSGQLKRAKVN